MNVRLTVINLDEEPFDALSYSWGGHLTLRRIITVNKRSFLVADTVLRALREIRSETQVQRIWIDAVCINQGDGNDKSSNIQIMGDIYRRAQKVFVWLVAAPAGFSSCVDAVQEIISVESGQIDHTGFVSNNWQEPLSKILQRRWWSRSWTVQEVALAGHVILKSGQHEIPWGALETALGKMIERRVFVPVDRKVLDFVENVHHLKHSQGDQSPEWLDLAIQFRHRAAGNPRDKLFAFEGLLNSTDSQKYVPEKPALDYRDSTAKIFAHFAAFYIRRDQNLSLLTLAEARHPVDCSWAVDWSKLTSAYYDDDPFSLGVEKDLETFTLFWSGGLISSPNFRSPSYSASAGHAATIQVQPEDWNSLLVDGWVVDTINKVGDKFGDVGVVDPSETVASWSKLAGARAQSAFFRLMDAAAYRDDLSTNSNADQRTERVRPSQTYCWQRRFFVAESGRLGLGPADTKRRDIVVVLFGSEVPMILRPQPPYNVKYYEFVGQAYVDGIMEYEGGAAGLEQDIADQKVRPRTFLIK